jgi:hypothetical protein
MARYEKGQRPTMIARAPQHPRSSFMLTIGAAWPFKEGEGFVVQLHAEPRIWDGKFILVPPKEDEETPEETEK